MKTATLTAAAVLLLCVSPQAKPTKPNMLVSWGGDVGMWNLSAHHRGMMGGSTPNIDRIAKGGMPFMDHYAQASCTAGCVAFITGRQPMRVGWSTVGLPGAAQGLSTKDPTLGSLLKPMDYATGQFGKEHLGDRDEHLPTNNGFDEFFGILGYDQTSVITGKGKPNRREFLYFTETVLHRVRVGDWKFLFKIQDKWFNVVQQKLATALITNLKLDPFERFEEVRGFDDRQEDRTFVGPMAIGVVTELVESPKQYPPRMASSSFDIDEAMKFLMPK